MAEGFPLGVDEQVESRVHCGALAGVMFGPPGSERRPGYSAEAAWRAVLIWLWSALSAAT